MIRLIRTELMQLHTLRSTYLVALATIVISAAVAWADLSDAGTKGLSTPGELRDALVMAPGLVTAMFAALFAASRTAGEYRHHTIAQRALASPRRWRMLAARLTTYGVLSALLGAVALAASYAIAGPVVDAEGMQLSLSSSDLLVIAGEVAAAGGLFAMLGVSVGFICRSQAPASRGLGDSGEAIALRHEERPPRHRRESRRAHRRDRGVDRRLARVHVDEQLDPRVRREPGDRRRLVFHVAAERPHEAEHDVVGQVGLELVHVRFEERRLVARGEEARRRRVEHLGGGVDARDAQPLLRHVLGAEAVGAAQLQDGAARAHGRAPSRDQVVLALGDRRRVGVARRVPGTEPARRDRLYGEHALTLPRSVLGTPRPGLEPSEFSPLTVSPEECRVTEPSKPGRCARNLRGRARP